jgi:hypothetical protein
VVIIALLAAVVCGVLGASGVESEIMHVVNQAIFGVVAALTAVAGLVFARGFQAAVTEIGKSAGAARSLPSPPHISSSPGSAGIPRGPSPRAHGAAGQSPGNRDDDDAGSTMSGAMAERFSMRFGGFVFRSFRANPEDAAAQRPDLSASPTSQGDAAADDLPVASAADSAAFRPSPRAHGSRTGALSGGAAAGSAPGSDTIRPATSGRFGSFRARKSAEARLALDTLRAVHVGLVAVSLWGALFVWALATGLKQPVEWLVFSACLRVVEVALVSAALYTVASGRNRFAGTVCCTTQVDFALCLWWKCCPCPRRQRQIRGRSTRTRVRGEGGEHAPSASAAAQSDASGSARVLPGPAAAVAVLGAPPPPRLAWPDNGSAAYEADGKAAGRRIADDSHLVEVAPRGSAIDERMDAVGIQEDADSRAGSVHLSRVGASVDTGSMPGIDGYHRDARRGSRDQRKAASRLLSGTGGFHGSASNSSEPEQTETNPIRAAAMHASLSAASGDEHGAIQPTRAAVVSWAPGK